MFLEEHPLLRIGNRVEENRRKLERLKKIRAFYKKALLRDRSLLLKVIEKMKKLESRVEMYEKKLEVSGAVCKKETCAGKNRNIVGDQFLRACKLC